MAALIGFRPVGFFWAALAFFGADLSPHFAHRRLIAAEMRFRAAALMRRRFGPLAGLGWLAFGGRPRRAGWEPSPTRAVIAFSIRLASYLSCVTML